MTLLAMALSILIIINSSLLLLLLLLLLSCFTLILIIFDDNEHKKLETNLVIDTSIVFIIVFRTVDDCIVKIKKSYQYRILYYYEVLSFI